MDGVRCGQGLQVIGTIFTALLRYVHRLQLSLGLREGSLRSVVEHAKRLITSPWSGQ